MGKQIASLERQIFSGNQQSSAILALGTQRRNVLSFRRIIEPERQLLGTIANAQKPFLSPDLHLYFDDVTDYANNLWNIINAYKDTIDGLHVTVESLLNRRVNKIISALTVISVALLPLNLLSGIYGMNIDGLPFAHTPSLVWGMFAALSVVIIALIIIMKRQKWL
jgi:magnesium transporter